VPVRRRRRPRTLASQCRLALLRRVSTTFKRLHLNLPGSTLALSHTQTLPRKHKILRQPTRRLSPWMIPSVAPVFSANSALIWRLPVPLPGQSTSRAPSRAPPHQPPRSLSRGRLATIRSQSRGPASRSTTRQEISRSSTTSIRTTCLGRSCSPRLTFTDWNLGCSVASAAYGTPPFPIYRAPSCRKPNGLFVTWSSPGKSVGFSSAVKVVVRWPPTMTHRGEYEKNSHGRQTARRLRQMGGRRIHALNIRAERPFGAEGCVEEPVKSRSLGYVTSPGRFPSPRISGQAGWQG